MKRELVDKLVTDGTPLTAALKAAELSSSSYYYHPGAKRRPRALDTDLVAAITIMRRGHNEVYGYRKITQFLKAQGMAVNAKKVLRHLRAMGLTQPKKLKGQQWTRLAVVKPDAPNNYWEADFTYVWAGQGNAYLCAIIDAWDRDIVGDVFSDRCRAVEAAEALEKAVLGRFGRKVPEGHQLTLRIDRGSQFRSRRFRETARLLNVNLEYAGIRCPEDKPYIESFNSSYKTEEIYRHEYRSIREARTGWEIYRAWYRNDRLHQSLDYLSPLQYAQKAQNTILLVADFTPV
ncbi:MAG: IS3 family transposase [Chloroflexota bacterium]|nr:IS3 family transposase [Chloroflexota bacterium]